MAIFIILFLFSIQSTPTGAQAAPAGASIEAFLTARETPVQWTGADGKSVSLNQDQTIAVQPGDKINVDEGGRGLLNVGNRVSVNIFRGTEFSLAAADLGPDGALSVQLKQAHGHTQVKLTDAAGVRVKLETDFATITSLTPGTEFLVCHDPTLLTCLDVRQGAVEAAGQSQVTTVRGGQSTYILKGQPPVSPTICEHSAEVDAWFDKMLSVGSVEPLGALVDRWRSQPCPDNSVRTNGPPATAAATPTPAVPPGLYVTDLRIQPWPVRGTDLKFLVTFLNSMGRDQTYQWKVYIFRAENPDRSFGETARTSGAIASGTVELPSNGSWKLTGGGGCENFFAQAGWVTDDNRIVWFTLPNGQIFQKGFSVCPG